MKTLLLKLLRRRKPKFGPRIFEQDSWLTKQVREVILNEQMHRDLIRK